MTPQELKNSILQLAIQGKLVEQCPEEGTAAELLEKIARHGTTGTHGTTKTPGTTRTKSRAACRASPVTSVSSVPVVPPIPDDEKPFDIPESWEWVRLGDVGSWASGATPSRTQAEYYGGNIPWLKTGDLNDGYVSNIPETITDLALEKTSVRLNPVGSVLMAMYGATIGKLGILQVTATTNQACCACIPYDGVWNKYLFYFLMARRRAFIKMGEGGAQPNISKEKIINAVIPLPPLAEQKRIVAKIEELLPLIDRYEKAWSKLEDFNRRFPVDMQKSLLQMAIQGKLVEQRPEEGTGEELLEKILAAKNAKVAKKNLTRSRGARGENPTASPRVEISDDEKPFDIPESWVWVRFSDLYALTNGTASRGTSGGTNHPVLRLADLSNKQIDVSSIREIPLSDKEFSSHILRTDDLIFIRVNGSKDRVASAYHYTAADSISYCDHLFCGHRTSDSVFADYIMFAFNCHSTRLQLLPEIKSTAGQNTISQASMAKILIPLPPLAEQKRIVAKLEEILPLCERLK